MKFLSVFAVALTLSGCMGTTKDIKKAEQILILFQCANIDSAQIPHSPITSHYEQTLYSSKQKANEYIKSYKDGNRIFDISLEEVVKQQYSIYKEACQNLGGIAKK